MNTGIILLIVFIFGVALTIYGEITGTPPKKYFSIFTIPLETRFNSNIKQLIYRLCWFVLIAAVFVCCLNLSQTILHLHFVFDIILALVMMAFCYLVTIMVGYFLFAIFITGKYYHNCTTKLIKWIGKIFNH